MALKKIIKRLTERSEPPILIEGEFELFTHTKRILLLRPDRIGDVIISTPFVKKLRQLFPNATIDVVMSHRNIGAVSAFTKYVNHIFVLQKGISGYWKIINKVRKYRYDILIDLLDNPSSTSSLLTRFTLSEFKLGFDKSNRNIYTHIVLLPDKHKTHIVDRLNSLLIPFQGSVNNEESISYDLPKELIAEAHKLLGSKNKKFRLGINLTGSNESKNWGTDNYIGFIKFAIENYPNIDIKVFTNKKNIKQLQEIEKVHNNVGAPLVGSFDLFVSMIHTCDIVLTPDTSVVHICSAFNIPCIALFTYSDDPNKGMPWLSTSKHSKNIKISEQDTLKSINISDVSDALKQIIEEIND